MRIICDCRDEVRRLVEAASPRGQLEEIPAGPDNGERALWKILAPGRSAHLLWWRPPDALGLADWPRLFVVARAPSSQFDVLASQAVTDARLDTPIAALALEGNGFHGQRGRPWVAEAGNLFLTATVFPQRAASDLVTGATMVPAVAAAAALDSLQALRVHPEIKWVNDLLLDGRKVAGVITGSRCQGDVMNQITWGLGINVLSTPKLIPTPFVPAVTSLRDHAPGIRLGEVLWAVLAALARRWHQVLRGDTRRVYQTYVERSVVIGRRVVIWPEESDGLDAGALASSPLAAGVVAAIEPDLSLRLQNHPDPIQRGRLVLAD